MTSVNNTTNTRHVHFLCHVNTTVLMGGASESMNCLRITDLAISTHIQAHEHQFNHVQLTESSLPIFSTI
jgi:hypothetical protein